MRSTTLLAIFLTAGILACRNEAPASRTILSPTNDSAGNAATMTPEQLGQLGAQIKKHPADAARLLSDHGLDEAAFERAVRKVAESPEQSKRYAAAYKKAS